MVEDYIDLYSLQLQIREGMEDCFPGKLWVMAEVSSIQVKSNGHCYMDLCQSNDGRVVAKAKAVVWRNRYIPLSAYWKEATGGDIAPGMQILVRVQVSYSELYGLSLTIDEIEPQFTIGEAELQKRRTIEKLEEDGLLQRQKELEVTALPYSLAVISARDAAGFGDFCRHLEQNAFGFLFSVHLFEATMQGESAPESIVEALETVQTSAEHYDAALIMRGGGSALDLACFDDYALCFSIANCSIPVYTAIGHDRDYHVADMVAYDFVKTPTALADIFIDAFACEDERIASLGTRLRLAFASKIAGMSSVLDVLEARIKNADPRNVLSRGYTLVTNEGGVVLKSSKKIQKGEKIYILFEDGKLEVTVDGKI